jgi:hypothetical protein
MSARRLTLPASGTRGPHMLYMNRIAARLPLAQDSGHAALKLHVCARFYLFHASNGEVCWMEQAIGYGISQYAAF